MPEHVQATVDGADPAVSFAQRRLWFLDQLRPGSPDHLLPLALRLRGELDAGALERALAGIVERHEVLRTRFVAVDGEPRAVLDAPGGPRLERTEAADADELFRRELPRPIDLSAQPPIRATLARLGPGDHLLLVVVHHIAVDGWSWDILLRELADGYRSVPVPPPAVQYAEFAAGQRRRLTGPRLEHQLDHWRGRLAGVEPLALPTDRPRPAFWESSGDVVRFAIPAGTVAGVDRVARTGRATRYMVLLAVYQALLGRYSGRTDVAVCTTLAVRDRAEVAGVIGPFVNTVVLRSDLSGRPSFAEALARVRAGALSTFSHAETPFELVVDAVTGERDLSRHPLCQASFTLLNTVRQPLTLPGVETELVPPPLSGTELDVFLDLDLRPDGGLAGRLQYSTALFDRDSMQRFAAGYVRLLEAVLATPDASLADLAAAIPPLPGRERRRLLEAAGAGAAAPAAPVAAAGRPDAVAVVEGDREVTYAQLDALAGGLAGRLAAAGVTRGSAVAVALPRGAESVAAMLAVWRAGAAYVPLDAGFPEERLRHMVTESGARWVVTPTAAGTDLGAPAVPMDEVRPGSWTGTIPAEHDLAYVIFTSGSTGRPKAVGVEHGALARHVAAARERYGITAADRVLVFASLTFDASLDQLLPALTTGATVVLRPDEQWLPARIPAVVERQRITVLNLPPTYWAELAAWLPPEDAPRLASLRTLILGGEVVPTGALGLWLARVPHVRVVNSYGPTEAVVTAATHDVVPDADRDGVPIGRPLGGRRAYVVDAWGDLAPAGIAGELLLGGPELARGYLGRPGLTAERFVPDPFGGDGDRLYRTGDLVRRRPDGELEFLGRVDDQLKIRGFRIEPAEVEAVLERCPGVLAAAAAARPDAQGGQCLVGYVVTGPDDAPGPAALRDWCARSLPPYEVPTDFVRLDALPVTAAGKLDRAALPDSRPDRSAAAASYREPRDETERMIAGIWADVLGVDRVGIDDGFFDLGGHSLLATMAVSRVAARLGREVELRTLFEAPRIRDFAPRVATAAATTADIVPVDRSGPLPLSFAQERLWFLDRMSDAGDEYVLWFSWRLRGDLDRDAWQTALDDVVARHEVLRTALAESGGRPVQRVRDDVRVPLEWHDLPAGEGGPDRPDRVRELARDFVTRRFDLAAPPMLRAGVWELGARDRVVVLAFHHVATDGWSKAVVVGELMDCYRERLAGRRSVLPPLPVQYADYAVWQRTRMSGELLRQRLAYWGDALSGLPALELPTDRPRPPAWTGRGAAVDLPLGSQLLAGVDEVARRCGATRFMVLLAAFQVVLARWCGQDDLAVGTPVAGRDRVELEGLVGFFVNTVVLRGDLAGDPGFAELVGRTRERVLGAFDAQDLPFERLVEELRPERDPSRTPLFQVMFDVQETAPVLPQADGLAAETFPLRWGSAKFDLTATFLAGPDRFALNLEYATDLFDEASALRFARHLSRVLDAAVADPARPIGAIDLLEPRERAELAAAAPAGPEPAVPPSLAGRPGDVAVICGDREVSYEQLDALAEGLRRLLERRGVGRGSAVGVCLPRGPWSVVAMLAVWRAGGVYVPLDTGFPPERLRFMVDEAGVAAVVSSAATAELVASLGAEPVPVEDVEPVPPAAPAAIGPADLAYVIFTSGSTGRPKAVGVEHGPLARHVAAARERFGITAEDRVLSFASLTFDASLEQILPALAAGARVVLRPDEVWSVDELADAVRTEGATVLELTPSYLAEVAVRLGGAGDITGDLKSLRLLVTGGEVLPASTLRSWFAALPDTPVTNTYGPTESVVSATAHLVAGPVEGRVPIGRPLGGRRAYVVDGCGDLAPVGVPGELLVGGPELARGYLGRPAATAERFVPDPYGGGGRLYRTGDRVRRLPGGELEFLGRLDDQVKIRGFRVEPGEVESVLREQDGVDAAAVLLREVGGKPALVGYVAGSSVDTDRVRAGARRSLPDHMVPAHLVVLDALPRTVQGKLDATALPAPVPQATTGGQPPASPTEIVTAQVWEEVLGVERAGLHDDFFALGGHSLRAVAAASRLRAAFDCPLQVRDLFEHPTVARLAAEIERRIVAEIAAMSEGEIDLSLTVDDDVR